MLKQKKKPNFLNYIIELLTNREEQHMNEAGERALSYWP